MGGCDVVRAPRWESGKGGTPVQFPVLEFPSFCSTDAGSPHGSRWRWGGGLPCCCYSDLLGACCFDLREVQRVRTGSKISDSKLGSRNIVFKMIIYFHVYRLSFMGWSGLFGKMLSLFLFIREISENKGKNLRGLLAFPWGYTLTSHCTCLVSLVALCI